MLIENACYAKTTNIRFADKGNRLDRYGNGSGWAFENKENVSFIDIEKIEQIALRACMIRAVPRRKCGGAVKYNKKASQSEWIA